MIHEAVLHRNAETAAECVVLRRLWRAVLVQALREARGHIINTGGALTVTGHHAERRRAREWIGSRDFREVCELAGVSITAAEVFEKIDGPLGEMLVHRTRRRQ